MLLTNVPTTFGTWLWWLPSGSSCGMSLQGAALLCHTQPQAVNWRTLFSPVAHAWPAESRKSVCCRPRAAAVMCTRPASDWTNWGVCALSAGSIGSMLV